jgi:transcriptional regulator with XRE-family HTH domain
MTFRTLRRKAGFTRLTLARASRVSTEVINKVENATVRDPRVSTVLGFALALNLPVELVAEVIRKQPRKKGTRRRRRTNRAKGRAA